ncbi:uncharacterized protein F54H12.2-like [Ambystoma mexicanum]|uniref:uncharacterized protein F54H12.2-like n=1 Tax=Ambystoma mexicanum TaxID=8296 RepID=UPI0037E7AE03
MAFINCASGECVKSELDLFAVPPTQTSIENSFFMKVAPLAALSPLAPIEFYISGSTEMYLDLNDTLLYLTCKITKADGSAIPATAKVATIAYPVATLFNQVDITLGDRLITQSDNLYAYRTYIESILNYSNDALDTQFTAGLFYKVTAGHMEDYALDGANAGFIKRATHARGSRNFDLLGRLHSDLFFQEKLMVNGVDLKIKLSRNKDAFCLNSDDAEAYKLIIVSASLFIKRVNVSPTVRLAHADALQVSNLKYPVERTSLKIFSVPAGSRVASQDNLFLGKLPKIIIIGFVDNTAFSGACASNPFNFKHYNINYASLFKDGVVIPSKAYSPSFQQKNTIREYLGLVSISGKHLHDKGFVIPRDDYDGGYTLLAFDLRPDNTSTGHYNLIRNGNLGIEVRFAANLPNTVNLIIMALFDSVMELNNQRQVLYDM